VVVLEAMKMENSLTAPIDGKVKSLPMAEGSSVVKGNILAVISPLAQDTVGK
jgi:biotin carboxyl carrier protein